MKTRFWAALLAAALAVSLLLCFLPGKPCTAVRVLCDGEQILTISLLEDREYTVSTQFGTNILRVEKGAIGVVSADCPGNDCIHMGFRKGGRSIVCLPNRLVLEFIQEDALDGISG